MCAGEKALTQSPSVFHDWIRPWSGRKLWYCLDAQVDEDLQSSSGPSDESSGIKMILGGPSGHAGYYCKSLYPKFPNLISNSTLQKATPKSKFKR
jgi:hypothetical protein